MHSSTEKHIAQYGQRNISLLSYFPYLGIYSPHPCMSSFLLNIYTYTLPQCRTTNINAHCLEASSFEPFFSWQLPFLLPYLYLETFPRDGLGNLQVQANCEQGLTHDGANHLLCPDIYSSRKTLLCLFVCLFVCLFLFVFVFVYFVFFYFLVCLMHNAPLYHNLGIPCNPL